MVNVEAIVADGATQCRLVTRPDYIEELAEVIREGGELPPVVLFYDKEADAYYIGDGYHRVCAHQAAELAEVEAIVHDGGEAEAVLYGAGSNNAHGLRASRQDRERAIERVLELKPEWSNREIARHCHASDHTVAKARKHLEEIDKIIATDKRVGADGVEQASRKTPPAESKPVGPPKKITGGTSFNVDELEDYDTGEIDIDAEAAVYRQACNDLNRIKRELEDLSVEPKHGVHLADKIVRISKQLDDSKADIWQAMPVEICGNCDGAGCKKCGNAGFLTRAIVQRAK